MCRSCDIVTRETNVMWQFPTGWSTSSTKSWPYNVARSVTCLLDQVSMVRVHPLHLLVRYRMPQKSRNLCSITWLLTKHQEILRSKVLFCVLLFLPTRISLFLLTNYSFIHSSFVPFPFSSFLLLPFLITSFILSSYFSPLINISQI